MYREAKCIELYDSNVSLSVSDEGPYDSYLLGRYQEANKPFLKVSAFDLLNVLAAVTDIDWDRASERIDIPVVCNTHQDFMESGDTRMESLANYEINIFKHVHSVDSSDADITIVELEAEVLSANLLNIYARVKWGKEEEESVYDMTYCGRFQVWWKS